jgi:hypothetical protein
MTSHDARPYYKNGMLGENPFGAPLPQVTDDAGTPSRSFGLGVNYVPLLIHAIDLVRRSAVAAAIADEAFDRRSLYAKYRRQSLWLLLPFVVGIAALSQMTRDQTVR